MYNMLQDVVKPNHDLNDAAEVYGSLRTISLVYNCVRDLVSGSVDKPEAATLLAILWKSMIRPSTC